MTDSMEGAYLKSRTEQADGDLGAWVAGQMGAGQAQGGGAATSEPGKGKPAQAGENGASGPSYEIRPLPEGGYGRYEKAPDGSEMLVAGAASPALLTPGGAMGPVGAALEGAGPYVAKTVLDLPMQTIGAYRDVINQVSRMVLPVSKLIDKAAPLGISAKGDLVTPFSSQEDVTAYLAGLDQGAQLPDVPAGKTEVSQAYRSIMRFVIGFKAVNNALTAIPGAAGVIEGGGLAVRVGKGALTDMLVWGEHEARLSNLIQSIPALQNPVTEWLQSKESDGMLVGKLKGAIEGMGIQIAAEGVKLLAKGISAIRAGRQAQTTLGDSLKTAFDQEAAAMASADRTTRDVLVLGDPKAGLTRTVTIPTEGVQAPAAAGAQMGQGTAGAAIGAEDWAAWGTVGTARGNKEAATAIAPEVQKILPNFAAISAPEDIDAVLQQMAAANVDLVKGAKGGVVSQKTQVRAAQSIGVEQIFGTEKGRFNAAELRALQEFYVESANTLISTAERAAQAPTEGNLYAFRKMMALHQALLEKRTGAVAEAGRALNILRVPIEGGNQVKAAQLTDVINALGGAEINRDLAEKVASLRFATPQALNEVTRRGLLARTADAVAEAYTLGLLQGGRTHARNIASNAAFLWQQTAETAVAARLPGATVEKGEATAATYGMISSLHDAIVSAGKSFWSGTAEYQGKIDLPPRRAISADNLGMTGMAGHFADAMGEFYALWGRALTSADQFFYTLNYSAELHKTAYREAIQQGLTGEAFQESVGRAVVEPSDSARLAAMMAGKYGTFTEQLGKAGQGWMQIVRSMPVPARFVTPYVRTPSNLWKAELERTPFAPLMQKVQNDIAAGGARADMAWARMALGTAVGTVISNLTSLGSITGFGPSDPSVRAAMRREGWIPYSFKIPGTAVTRALGMVQPDKENGYLHYQWLQPIGTLIGATADTTERIQEYEAMQNADDPAVADKSERMIYAAVFSLANAVVSPTFMRGLSQFVVMLSEPDQYAERYVQQFAAAFVPRVAVAVREQFDPYQRDALTVTDAVKAQLPILSSEVAPLRDLWGEPVKLPQTYGPKFISPINKGTPEYSPADRAIVENKVPARKPSLVQGWTDETTGKHVSVDMRNWPEVFDEFQRLAGHALDHPELGGGAKKVLDEIVTGKHELSDVYNAQPNGSEQGVKDKGNFIMGILSQYRELAKDAILHDPKYDKRFGAFRREVAMRALRKDTIEDQAR